MRSADVRKRPASDVEMSLPKRGRPKSNPALSRYPPVHFPDVGDDGISNARNLALLQKEMEREKPRKDTVLQLLKHTFALRRDDILSDAEDVSIATILLTHPALALPYAVSHTSCILVAIDS